MATYGAAWNETDEAKRTALLEEWCADDGVYQDPIGTADSRARHTIDFASGVDITDAGLSGAWVMRNGDEVALEGMDFAELAPDGRIQRIAGFFGPFPPLDD